ncbi:MAG TPA: lauroyl acyltransferase, partial [Alphaproteobacteria bacterium]|nr:lauroyl acyltransferase [Alphaproteobacteria bacterium]
MGGAMADRGGGFSISRSLAHIAQAAAAYGIFFFSRLLPFAAASGLGGWAGRALGPRLPVNELARKNLERAFPEKDAAEIGNIITAMWDNLGRTAFEYPHLDRLKIYDGDIVDVTGVDRIDALKNDGKPGIFFAGHLANWEIPALTVARRG